MSSLFDDLEDETQPGIGETIGVALSGAVGEIGVALSDAVEKIGKSQVEALERTDKSQAEAADRMGETIAQALATLENRAVQVSVDNTQEKVTKWVVGEMKRDSAGYLASFSLTAHYAQDNT